MCFLLLCGLSGCDEEPETPTEEIEATGETTETPEETTPTNVAPIGTAETTPSAPANVHLDLLELSHLADVDHAGLFVDFGTQSRFKYTSGNWNSGWLGDGTRGGVSFSRMGNMGRIYFDVAEAGALHLHLKVRNVGGGPLLAFMNGETLRENQLERGEFHDVVIEVPAEHVRAGENYLLLRGTETASVEGESVSFEIAELHVTRGSRGSDWTAPRGLRSRVSVGGSERDALDVPADTSLTWYVDVPENGVLVLGHGASAAGSGTLTVRGQIEGGEPVELASSSVAGSWREERISLERIAGDLARLEVEIEGGEGRAQWAAHRVRARRDGGSGHRLCAACRERPSCSASTPCGRASCDPTTAARVCARPPLERFATEGVVFERAQTPENWTKPAVASILTSLFPATHGAKNDSSRLPQTALTLGEVYKEHGFTTASFLANGYVSRGVRLRSGLGPLHQLHSRTTQHERLECVQRSGRLDRGAQGRALLRLRADHRSTRPLRSARRIPPDVRLPRGDSYTGQVRNRRTHLLLEDAKRRPPRVTFDASDVTRLEALHDGEISYHDRHFDAFLRKLDELGLMEKTIFVVTSDHGEEFNEHGSWGHGHSIFQELLHVPLIVRYPGVGSRGPSRTARGEHDGDRADGSRGDRTSGARRVRGTDVDALRARERGARAVVGVQRLSGEPARAARTGLEARVAEQLELRALRPRA